MVMKLTTEITKGSSGIYKIENILNGRIYYGSSANLLQRYKYHLYCLLNNKHANKFLQADFIKCGPDSFEFSVLEITTEDLLSREQFYIDSIFGSSKSYNILSEAGTTLGYRHSEEAKNKIALASKKQNRSKERYEKISKALKGRTGHLLSEEARKKISEKLKGRTFTEEHRKALAEASSGKVCSEQTKEKLRKANTGIKNPNFGLIRNENTKNKMREAWVKRRQREKINGKKKRKESIRKPTTMYAFYKDEILYFEADGIYNAQAFCKQQKLSFKALCKLSGSWKNWKCMRSKKCT